MRCDAGFTAVPLQSQNFLGLRVECSQAIMPEDELEVSVLNRRRPILWRWQCLDRLRCRLLYKRLRKRRIAFPRKRSGELDEPCPHVFLCRDDSYGTSANWLVRRQALRWIAAHAWCARPTARLPSQSQKRSSVCFMGSATIVASDRND